MFIINRDMSECILLVHYAIRFECLKCKIRQSSLSLYIFLMIMLIIKLRIKF